MKPDKPYNVCLRNVDKEIWGAFVAYVKRVNKNRKKGTKSLTAGEVVTLLIQEALKDE